MVPAFMNTGERSTEKDYHPASILSLVTKICKRLVNNKLVNPLHRNLDISQAFYKVWYEKTQALWNFRFGICPNFIFPQ